MDFKNRKNKFFLSFIFVLIIFGLDRVSKAYVVEQFKKNNKSIHLEKFINFPKNFENKELNEKWSKLIKIRDICNISIEEKRTSKEIGSSLEANIDIKLNKEYFEISKNIDFSELCITSSSEVIYNENIETSAETTKAKGTKCPVCWKIIEAACLRKTCPKHSE